MTTTQTSLQSSQTKKAILGSHPFELFLAMDKMFDKESWLSWDPETLIMLLHDGDAVPEECKDKLLAVQAVGANGNAVCTDMRAFEKVVQAFNNNPCVMDVDQPPHVEEICYAVPQIQAIIRKANETEEDVNFTCEVPGYVAAVAKYRGWTILPPILNFASDLFYLLTGLSSDYSRKVAENEELLVNILNLFKKVKKENVGEILDNDLFSKLDDKERLQLCNVVGSLVYDPTILHRG